MCCPVFFLFIPVMRTALNDEYCAVFYPVDDPVAVVDPSAPVCRKVSAQSLWLANAFVTVPLNILYQQNYPLHSLFILILPVQEVFPCFVRPRFNHHPPREARRRYRGSFRRELPSAQWTFSADAYFLRCRMGQP